MSRVTLSREAEHDLQAISDYTVQEWGVAQARRYLNGIYQSITKLAKNPKLGHVHADIPAPYLVFAVGKHLIVYRVAGDHIDVHYIPHSAMDLAARISGIIRQSGDSDW
jgi:toxin ParE1/3/4